MKLQHDYGIVHNKNLMTTSNKMGRIINKYFGVRCYFVNLPTDNTICPGFAGSNETRRDRKEL